MLGAHPARRGCGSASTGPDAERSWPSWRPASGAVELRRTHPAGLFEGAVEGAALPLRYELEVRYPDGHELRLRDPYAFPPTLGELDLHLVVEGRHESSTSGSAPTSRDRRCRAARPSRCGRRRARSVSVVGDFNSLGRAPASDARRSARSGVWELFVPGVGRRRALQVRDPHAPTASCGCKADPFAFEAELPPGTASVVSRSQPRLERRRLDRAAARDARPPRAPMSIYEVHLGSWRLNPLEGNRSLTYLELADELAALRRDLGFTHVELLPVMAHPFAGSWGYQVTSYYAPTPRFGSPDDFRDVRRRACTSTGIGVILDWVPAHFPRDDWALARFDGTALYEHADPRRGAHPDWGTLVFNFGRHEVRNFLIANALFWLREYHADGLRVDAVASMLYLDYSRKAGEWVPNEFGGREDLDAVAFLQGAQRGRLRPRAGRDLGGRGVDRMAGRVAADIPRRPRLRLQVEHGLDARHARLLRAATRSTAATTTTS